MELMFTLTGAMCGFTYRILIQELDVSSGVLKQSTETIHAVGEDGWASEVKTTLRTSDAEQELHRFIIEVLDVHEGLSMEEMLVARRDLTLRGHTRWDRPHNIPFVTAPTATANLATMLDIQQIVKGGENARAPIKARPPIKSKCALLFFGLPKRFKEVVLPSIRKHILPFNTECDIFMHMYNVTDWNTERHQEGLTSTRNGSLQPDDVYLFTEATGIMSEREDDFRRQRNMTYFEHFFPWAPHHQWRFPG